MTFDLTKQSFFTTFLYFVLFAVVFWRNATIEGVPSEMELAVQNIGNPLEQIIDNWLAKSPLTGVIISALLMFINSMMVARLTIRNVFFTEKGYLPALMYLLVSSGYYSSFMSFRSLAAAMFIIIVLGIAIRSSKNKELASGDWLIIGFGFGVATVIYTPVAYLIPLLFIALIMFRLFDVREWVATIAGIALPLAASGYVMWITGYDLAYILNNFHTALITSDGTIPALNEVTIAEWIFIGTAALISILSIFSFVRVKTIKNQQAAKAFGFLIWMALGIIAAILYAPCRSIYLLPVLAIPMAIILSAFFDGRKPSAITTLLYALLILSAVAIHIISYLNTILF